ncbi:helicase with zinc finger domain 2 isoform X1 [Falco peregrinus]|uniref:helicase with zinc finger domain 2 isoform X1 n=2 Tax=Falco peregrinus TaxID=8954 RepID=UPI000FFBD18A|nr:helicase with zinc finger domain 2 isoform X1 [Falco peregrinus]XP_055669990.1 helicase with zinc finger domain 2 isoform X1 [Falco peregrinus]XP_055669991.1 helicase with zinc finger domain 2 isoform X1 [Falco peregrinus]XP_055669992.1 helicase with zinc finger domain 2 isoform X1 [Falco peregrinus]
MPTANGPAVLLGSLQQQLELRLVCSKCSIKENEITYQLREVEHRCMYEILLARCHSRRSSAWRKVSRRPGFPNPARYAVCRYYTAGLGCSRHKSQCTFAWSSEEAIVWNFEREQQLERRQLKAAVLQEQLEGHPATTPNPTASAASEIASEFGGQFQEICKRCFFGCPQRISVGGQGRLCKSHRTWDPLLVHVVSDSRRKQQYSAIRPFPEFMPTLSYCRFVSKGQPCKHGPQRCRYAHSDVEMAIWEAEREHGLVRSDLLPAVGTSSTNGELVAPTPMQFYCRVCLVTFSSQESFESHCASVEHVQMLSDDSSVQWVHRTPPLGLTKFSLCSRAEVCEMGNSCTKAHSPEELQEWIQRVKVAVKKKKQALKEGLLSYQDRLIAEYQMCSNEVLIMAEHVEGVRVVCKQPLHVQSEDRKMKYCWKFKVHSQMPLQHVALLKREPGVNFYLSGNGLSRGLHYIRGEHVATLASSPPAALVEVCMECCTLGIFEQWVVFDFGKRPVLMQKIKVKVGRRETPQHIPSSRESSRPVNFVRWDRGNRIIVPSVPRTGEDMALLAKYKPPALALDYQSEGGATVPITRLNYRERMHRFLFREEEAEQALVAKLNLRVLIMLTPMLQSLSVGMKFALSGELFAEVPTPYNLSPDTDEGYLLSRSVPTAFLALDPPVDNRVYEVSVEHKATTEKTIWLQIPKRCCLELKFKPNTSHKVEIQFQIDQLLFRQWHQAVDRLLDEKLVLPDVASCSVPYSLGSPQKGNSKQKLAISFITGQATTSRQVPPLLIYGPFGTGKTFTLAMATMEILRQPKTRVLICTHTNSAADIYIREYFHHYVTNGHPWAVPLRIISTDRPINLTDSITQMYCCISPDQRSFRHPTQVEIDRHRIIITTSMLSKNLKVAPGYFTHIMIDEAAQMLECEALVPLSYATFETRIVLAGDHMQITPKLFCVEDGQSADHTLLNRLFQFYQKEKHEVAMKSRIIFNENYRSTAGIIEFVSKHFYIGKGNAIQASGNIPPHPEIYPLVFCHVSGVAERDMSMISWHNASEIIQVVEKVKEIYQRWPDEWGVRDLKRICVVSHGMQVSATRQELRKKQLQEVVVENYENLPGREFRVIIISTVHTSESLRLSASHHLEFFNEARVLNTIMTRAQSLVVVVGDAVALCSHGQCSKVWKRFIQQCIEKGSIFPENLTMAQIKQAACDKESWSKRSPEGDEEDSDTDSWSSEAESMNPDDPILQELLDESKNVLVTVSEEGLLNVKSEASNLWKDRQEYVSFSSRMMQEYLHMHPKMYKRCELIKEGFDRASAFTLNDSPAMTIQIKGRVHCGTAFTGDEVLVEILQNITADSGSHRPQGKVVGILKRAEREWTFICMMDEFDPRVMIPIDPTVTKIFVPGLKEKPNVIPIRRLVNGKYRVISCEKISQEMRRCQLFCVQVISWREGFYYPLGIITEILHAALTLEEGLKILNLEYSLEKKYPSAVTKELAKYASSSKLNFAKENLKDCRNYLTFTVDPKGARDLDDAVSVRDLGHHYEIGIHIADVAAIIPKGSALDLEAKKRGVTYYAPSQEPLSMFPPHISQDVCSLLPQKDRRVISLFVTVEKTTDRMLKGVFTISVICSDRQLSYEEAELCIKSHYRGASEPLRFDTLEDCIAVAYHFSRIHRKFRLQEDCFYDRLDEESSPGNRGSHQMIEELMIMFNSFVAEFLTNQEDTRNATPLRCQCEPNPQQLSLMKNKYNHILPLSIHLSHHLGEVPPSQDSSKNVKFSFLAPIWQHLQSAANRRDFHKMLDLVVTDDIHPKLAPVALEFRRLLGRSYFSRSNSTVQSKVGHYSLHVDSYTWASSPIRRYVDVVVQRHLHSVLHKKPIVYSSDDIEFLCRDFNKKNSQATTYEKRAHCLQMATQLKDQALQKVAFVVDIEGMNKYFKALFPLNKESLPDPQRISYRSLQLIEQPVFIEERNSIKLMWKRRVYSMQTMKEHSLREGPLCDCSVTLFSTQTWQNVLTAIRREEFETAASLLEKSKELYRRHVGRIRRSPCSHYMEVSLELSAGDVLQFQLTTDVYRGFLVPFVQLWCVMPGFDICLQHAEKPVECFSAYATLPSKDKYKHVTEYSKVWMQMSAIESASCAVDKNDSIILHDVQITWARQRTSKGQLQGSFLLNKTFLEECSIEVDFNHCYLCIRLGGLKLGSLQSDEECLSHGLQNLTLLNKDSSEGRLVVDPDTYTWVAHGVTEEFSDNAKSDRTSQHTLTFYIHSMSMRNIPVEISQASATFTVELIPKMLPDIRKEKAIWRLKHASELAKSIALGHEPPKKETVSKILQQKCFDLPGSHRKLNQSQNQAILNALRKPFTLIQGPPGTGKTIVGTHIVYWFHKLNDDTVKEQTLSPEEKPKGQKCILYCGPSRKSVDVVAEMLLKMKNLKPLRVYGEAVEAMEFPYPGSNRHFSRKALRDAKPKRELSEIILHHRIRRPPNPFCQYICNFDARMRRGEQITEEETRKYKNQLSAARMFELEAHDVILCTCSAASATSLEQLNVKQIIIDECAMSTEPETLIPLVSHPRAEKVVLLGDHKQLRPVVKNDLCKSLGMETSLFERYRNQAWMLDTQYRMHKSICEFPSQEFYETRLKTCPQPHHKRSVFHHKNNNCCPIIFGHMEGKEQSLMISTEEGNENSKANLEEAMQAVRIAKQLTLDGTIQPESIAILSPYSAQVSEIGKSLQKEGISGVTACTINNSQGSEWRYVILSTVRSCPRSEIDRKPTKSWQKKYLGFVTDPNQVNVGITRAQEGLCIIGNRYLLECNPLWKKLLQHYRQHNCVTAAQGILVSKVSAFRR